MKYRQQSNHHQSRKRARQRNLLIFMAVVLTVIFGGGYALIRYIGLDESRQTSTVSLATNSYFASSNQVFRSPYFQFEAGKNWGEDTKATKDGEYVYRSTRNGLLEHTFIVYVNKFPADLKANRVMAVSLNGNRGVIPGKLSIQCAKNPQTNSKEMTLESIRFNCHGDLSTYSVLIGTPGGTTKVTLPRTDGSAAEYAIYYSNFTDSPDAVELETLLHTFQTR
jgi:hypothetical protein